MARFEKIIIPLITDYIKPEDFTDNAGFADTYTEDPDKPSGENEFFIVFDDTIRSKESIDRAIRYNQCSKLKRTYIKYISGIPYLVYSFWINPTIKNLYKGTFSLNAEQKLKIAQFWGDSDIVNDVLSNTTIQTTIQHSMPLSDYRSTIGDKQLKGIALKYATPFFRLIIEHILVRTRSKSTSS